MENQKITVEANVNAAAEKVWKLWSAPEHITNWCSASEDWHAPHAENDLRVGGKFSTRMEAKDGSFGFDFGGIYDEVDVYRKIAYTLGDNRKVVIVFSSNGDQTHIKETFDTENENPIEMQQTGWQNILDNFKTYTENHSL